MYVCMSVCLSVCLSLPPETSEALLQQLLSFAVVGGGPTGVEFTGGLSDFIQEELLVLYPNLKVLLPTR